MSEFKILMPKLGESVQEATITKWFVKEGDRIEEDGPIFEVATDKVDSEIPSPVDGVVKKIFFPVNSLVPVGETVAIIDLEGGSSDKSTNTTETDVAEKQEVPEIAKTQTGNMAVPTPLVKPEIKPVLDVKNESKRFYSPLVFSIAKSEQISLSELESISGSGLNNRVQKKDILNYIEAKRNENITKPISEPIIQTKEAQAHSKVSVSIGSADQIIEMDRVRKIIAEHMVMSKQISPHVTSVVEADVTNLVLWRNKIKEKYLEKYGEKITFMPVFVEATAKAITEYPLLNSSVDGHKIIVHKDINIAVAVAKPDGNLVVPVIKNSELKNLVGLSKNLNQLADAARKNKLGVEDYQGGTFTITNFGSFRNLIGTPIINQPQVAILATGSIEKKPAVMETPTGDAIVVRHKMFLSLSYDHRIIDGALGGAFLRRIADILEDFDINREV